MDGIVGPDTRNHLEAALQAQKVSDADKKLAKLKSWPKKSWIYKGAKSVELTKLIVQVIVLAMLVEAVWETLKMLWQSGKFSIDRAGALSVGLLLAIGTRLDLLELIKITVYIPYLGIVLTGILISRGANFVHDLIKSITKLISDER